MKISGIVITKNEEKMISDCLISLDFCDEIIVVDSGSTDHTNKIALDMGAKVIKSNGKGYSDFRNDGLKKAAGDWILFLDADERVTPLLKNEILQTVKNRDGVYQIPRQNIFLGKAMHYGGWGNEYVIRLFSKKLLLGYNGDLHEQPNYQGKLHTLKNPINHFSHRSLESMLEKTLGFTNYESDLRLKNSHPKMKVWRFVRVMFTEFWLRFVKLQAWKDGVEGIIDASFQVFNMFIIYARLWEKQNYESRNI